VIRGPRHPVLLAFENIAPPVCGNEEWSYGVARVVGQDPAETPRREGSVVLAKTRFPVSGEVGVDLSECLAVPDAVTAALALQAPSLAVSLWFWDRLALELGEVAVYSFNPSFPFVGQAALWRGGVPVLQVGGSDMVVAPGVEVLTQRDPREIAERITERSRGNPGFAAVELSGLPEIMDVFLEVLPRWSRLMLAGYRSQPLTVDFYNNIHRKGVRIETCSLDPLAVFDRRTPGPLDQMAKAFGILANPVLAQTCLRPDPVRHGAA
jgi:hypothetical protein